MAWKGVKKVTQKQRMKEVRNEGEGELRLNEGKLKTVT